MSLRKAAKANWHWDCRLCSYTSPRSEDRFGAELFGWDHEHGSEHVGNELVAALKPVGEALTTLVDAFTEVFTAVADNLTTAFEQMSYALAPMAPPQNVPHDPAQRRDKRVWGGK